MKLIDKDAVVAEIWKRRNKHSNFGGSPSSEYCHEDDEILGIINTLEVKKVKEEPVSEKKCMFTKDIYTDEDRKVLCENCEEKCEYSKKEEPVSGDLEEAIKEASEKERLHKAKNGSPFFMPTDFASGFKAGAQWQKDKTISKAVEWLQRNIDSSMWLMNFKKSMEE